MYIFVHPPILTSQTEVKTILSSHCLLYFMVANGPIRSTSSLPLFCVQILYQITVHWKCPIRPTSSFCLFLQIVVPHHRSPLFAIFLSDQRPLCLFFCVQIFYQITVHWKCPIRSTSSFCLFLQIVVPHHCFPLFVIIFIRSPTPLPFCHYHNTTSSSVLPSFCKLLFQ